MMKKKTEGIIFIYLSAVQSFERRHILMQDRKHQQAIGISFFFVEYICSNIEIQIQKAILILLNIK